MAEHIDVTKKGIKDLIDERDKFKKDFEDLKGVATIKALELFEEEKDKFAEYIGERGGTPEEVEAFMNKIETPKDLIKIKTLMNLTDEMKRSGQHNKGGTTADDPPQGSVVTLRAPHISPAGEYASYGDMIDDLKKKANEGDTNAQRSLDRMWDKIPNLVRKKMDPSFKIFACPKCGRGILSKHDICPYCDFPVKEQRGKGMEV